MKHLLDIACLYDYKTYPFICPQGAEIMVEDINDARSPLAAFNVKIRASDI
jgi:hypothetical protein